MCTVQFTMEVKKSTIFFLNLGFFLLFAIALIIAGEFDSAVVSFWGILAVGLFYFIKNKFSAIILSGITLYYVLISIYIPVSILLFGDIIPYTFLLISIILIIISYFNIIVIKKIIRGEQSFVTIKELDFDLVIDKQTEYLLYFLSILVPIAGMVIGAIYVTKKENHLQFVGKKCLRFSLITTVICSIIIIVSMV